MPLNTQYICTEGQSWRDVVLNTYGSLDYYVKGLADNGAQPENPPTSGRVFMWDSSLIGPNNVQQLLAKQKIKYATLTGFGEPEQPNPSMSTYKDTLQAQYTASAAAGETSITITDLQNNEIVQIDKGIQPLLTSQYTFTPATGVINLVGVVLEKDETLFIIYKKTVTV